MPDVKISALPASTTPLAGTEVLPIVQSSTTRQVSVANLTAGRAVSALSIATTTGATFATTSGNVGIGTSSVTAKLQVKQSSTDTLGIFVEGSANDSQLRVYNNGTVSGLSSSYGTTGSYMPLAFLTSDTERMRIDASGNLLQNITTYPFGGSNRFVSKSATTTTQQIYAMCSANDSSTYIGNNGTVGVVGTTYGSTGSYLPLTFYTSDAERMRIDASGNVGIGVTPNAWFLTNYKTLQIGTGSLFSQTNGSDIRLSSNAYLSTAPAWTYINGTADYATSYEQTGGEHRFFNAPSGTGAISFTQAMTLNASGSLLVNTTATGGSNLSGFVSLVYAGGTSIDVGHNTSSSSGATYAVFRYNGTDIGSITQSGTTAVLYNVTSDQRLKENIVDAPSGNINDIKVRSFDWKSDGSHVDYGFIAQELITVAPYAVSKPENPEEMMAVDYSKLVPMMIKEIQDLKQRIATLENK